MCPYSSGIMSTQLSDLPLCELRAMLRNTERAAGLESQAAQILRRIVTKREQAVPSKPEGAK